MIHKTCVIQETNTNLQLNSGPTKDRSVLQDKYVLIWVMLKKQTNVHKGVDVSYIKNIIFLILWHSEDGAFWYILIIKSKRCTYFSNLFLG